MFRFAILSTIKAVFNSRQFLRTFLALLEVQLSLLISWEALLKAVLLDAQFDRFVAF
jgi:hypothetical protein